RAPTASKRADGSWCNFCRGSAGRRAGSWDRRHSAEEWPSDTSRSRSRACVHPEPRGRLAVWLQADEPCAVFKRHAPEGGAVGHEIAKRGERTGGDAFAVASSEAFAVAAVAVAAPDETAAVSVKKIVREVGIARESIQARTSRQISVHVRVVTEPPI